MLSSGVSRHLLPSRAHMRLVGQVVLRPRSLGREARTLRTDAFRRRRGGGAGAGHPHASSGTLRRPCPWASLGPARTIIAANEAQAMDGAKARLTPRTSTWQKLLNRLGQSNFHVSGGRVFAVVVRHANSPMWHVALPMDFGSKHMLTAMHVWLLHKRLRLETDTHRSAQMLTEVVFDSLWENTEVRIRESEVPDLLITKRLEEIQHWTLSAFVALDQAFSCEPPERIEKLHDIVFEYLFNGDENRAHEDEVQTLVEYLMEERRSLMDIPYETLSQGQFEFGQPAWRHLSRAGDLDADWKEATTADGLKYYYNVHSRESRWEKPSDLAAAETAGKQAATNSI